TVGVLFAIAITLFHEQEALMAQTTNDLQTEIDLLRKQKEKLEAEKALFGGSTRIGIEPSMREAVMQRGVRADEAAQGTGLGLARGAGMPVVSPVIISGGCRSLSRWAASHVYANS